MIRAMLVKELWDLRGVLAISTLGYLYWLYAFTHMTLPEWGKFQFPSHPLPFEPDGFVQSLIVYASVVAAFLGLYQGMADTEPARLQFLLSRPISRSQVALARVTIGLCLWASGCLTTLLAAIWFSLFFPIDPAPLEAWMLTKSLGWLAMGTTIYLGGFLSGIRPGFWFGTRLFPLFGAIGWWYIVLFPIMINQNKFDALAVFAGSQWLFWSVLVASNFVLILSIIFILKQSLIEISKRYRNSLHHLMTYICAVFGISFLTSVGLFSLVVIGFYFFRNSLPLDAKEITSYRMIRESLGFTASGEPVIANFGVFNLGPVPTRGWALDAMNSKRPGAEPEKSPLATGFYSSGSLEKWRSAVEAYEPLSMVIRPGSDPWSKAYFPYLICTKPDEIIAIAVNKNNLQFWYLFLHKNPVPHAYFGGFDPLSRMPLGYVGKNGAQVSRPSPDESFHLTAFEQSVACPLVEEMTAREHSYPIIQWQPRFGANARDMPKVAAYSPVWLATEDGVVECDLADKRIAVVSHLKDIKKLTYFIDRRKEQSFPLAIASDRIQVLERGGRILANANFKVDFEKNNSFFLTNQNDVIIAEDDVDPLDFSDSSGKNEVKVHWFQKNGDLKESKNIVLQVKTEPVSEGIKTTLPEPMVLFTLVSGLSGVVLDLFVDRRTAGDVFDNYFGNYFPRVLAVTLFSMALCLWRQHRYGRPWQQTLGWLAFIALFGVSGWFGYRFHKRWPLLIHCESCSRKRPVDLPYCPCCHAEFRKPASGIQMTVPLAPALQPQTA